MSDAVAKRTQAKQAPSGRPAELADLLDGRRITPMLRQFLDVKQEVPDALLFFRMGDFYELFFEDAVIAAEVAGLTLTARDKSGDNPIPMAGVPHHAVKGYIQKLIDQGHKVAICDQLEDPKLARGIVKRGITQVITPGVILDPDDLDARAANYLVALWADGDVTGLACIDVSTGEFRATELAPAGLSAELARLAPAEVVFAEEGWAEAELDEVLLGLTSRRAPVPDHAFDHESAVVELCELYGLRDLSGLGLDELPRAVQAAGAILHYLRAARLSALRHIRRVEAYRVEQFMVLDEATRRNLELYRTMAEGRRSGSLLGLLDRAVTGMGSRRIRQWIGAPLLQVGAITDRHRAVAILVEQGGLREQVRERLKLVQDIERLAGKVSAGRATPRDLGALRQSLQQVPALDVLLDRADTRELVVFAPLPALSDLREDLEEVLVDEPPAVLKDGGVVRAGFDRDLDELTRLTRDGKGSLAKLEADEREATGISSLKVRYNRVFGYYIEVTRANLAAVPERYIRKQTLANAERYFTPELKEFEAKVLGADERRMALETELFTQLRERVADRCRDLTGLAERLAAVDAISAFAELAVRHGYVQPDMDGSRRLVIEAGRHPVIERMKLGERFVPNDTTLDPEQQLLIVSGPNMAGKSTVMRQVALIVLMAQAGSFVPATSAHIGVVDRIFTRVGASDNIARGQSTFMVEMAETANILAHATDRSLAILDEIGRGTSTYDGVAIAWSVAEYIADTLRCRTMFATHYHELAELARTRDHVVNVNIAVSEMGGRVIFLRRLRPGSASRSYGIAVAKLAGLPPAVVDRAREVLGNLEDGPGDEPRLARSKDHPMAPKAQLSLFGDRTAVLKSELMAVDPDRLTPLEALTVLADLKRMAEGL